MKKIIFFGIVIVGCISTIEARKIGCQFEAIRQKIEALRQNATATWKAIKKLNKKLVQHEEKIFMKKYKKYKNPYFKTHPMKAYNTPVIEIEAEDIQNDDMNNNTALIIDALQQAIAQ